jgi:hypothetical protein
MEPRLLPAWARYVNDTIRQRVIICHCGGALDRFIPNDDRHIAQKDLSQNLFYDTCGYDVNFLEAALK